MSIKSVDDVLNKLAFKDVDVSRIKGFGVWDDIEVLSSALRDQTDDWWSLLSDDQLVRFGKRLAVYESSLDHWGLGSVTGLQYVLWRVRNGELRKELWENLRLAKAFGYWENHPFEYWDSRQF
jgi:hypothetical protein